MRGHAADVVHQYMGDGGDERVAEQSPCHIGRFADPILEHLTQVVGLEVAADEGRGGVEEDVAHDRAGHELLRLAERRKTEGLEHQLTSHAVGRLVPQDAPVLIAFQARYRLGDLQDLLSLSGGLAQGPLGLGPVAPALRFKLVDVASVPERTHSARHENGVDHGLADGCLDLVEVEVKLVLMLLRLILRRAEGGGPSLGDVLLGHLHRLDEARRRALCARVPARQ
mmetsp:Transcript_34585/g.91911  ORF Transcript_34585/g.91911 Transcript_34585/m.91911 type:complete len:226 (-) Transcript_34585:1335-2012(-)